MATAAGFSGTHQSTWQMDISDDELYDEATASVFNREVKKIDFVDRLINLADLDEAIDMGELDYTTASDIVMSDLHEVLKRQTSMLAAFFTLTDPSRRSTKITLQMLCTPQHGKEITTAVLMDFAVQYELWFDIRDQGLHFSSKDFSKQFLLTEYSADSLRTLAQFIFWIDPNAFQKNNYLRYVIGQRQNAEKRKGLYTDLFIPSSNSSHGVLIAKTLHDGQAEDAANTRGYQKIILPDCSSTISNDSQNQSTSAQHMTRHIDEMDLPGSSRTPSSSETQTEPPVTSTIISTANSIKSIADELHNLTTKKSYNYFFSGCFVSTPKERRTSKYNPSKPNHCCNTSNIKEKAFLDFIEATAAKIGFTQGERSKKLTITIGEDSLNYTNQPDFPYEMKSFFEKKNQ